LIGFDAQDQTRITTAISEIARNAYEYARGGHIGFHLTDETTPPSFVIVVRDRGPGIADLAAVQSGSRASATGMGIGLNGAQRLMDTFGITSKAGEGTTVRLGKMLPRTAPPITPAILRRITDALSAGGTGDAIEEITRQNQQILLQMDELRSRQEDLQRLNQELQDTNRGVVALYAELDERADHLRRADELKSKFLSHMSHEFRTPLNSILALSRLLLARSDGELTTEQETQVRFIRKAAENLTELVDDLLDLAKVEAGKTVVVPSRFTVTSLFGALRGMLRPLLVGDAVALVFEDPNDVPSLDQVHGVWRSACLGHRGSRRRHGQLARAGYRRWHRGRGHRHHLPGIRPGRTSAAGSREGHGPRLALGEEAGRAAWWQHHRRKHTR
jgi:signal transduction histidine kinase